MKTFWGVNKTKRKTQTVLFLFALFLMNLPTVQVQVLTPITQETQFALSAGENWLTGWDYRKNFTVIADGDIGNNPLAIDMNVWYGTGTDSDSNVYLNAHCQDDFSDIRFTASDGNTSLYYWREEYSTLTSAVFWVNFTLPLAGTDKGYIYYGNDGVSTTSDGHNVMNFFDDFETNDLNDYWEVVDDDWSVTTVNVKHGTYAAFGDSGAGGAGRSLQQDTLIDETTWANGSFPLMVHAWMRFSSLQGDEYQAYSTDSDANVYWSMIYTNDWCTYNTVDSYKYYATDCFSIVTWYRLEVGISFSGDLFVPYLDRVLQTTQALDDYNNNAVDLIKRVILYTDPTIGRDLTVDDYYVRVWGGAGEGGPYNWGEEEGEGAPTTTTIISEFEQWSLDTLLIILGLVMIPTSTIYLAYGAKYDRSSDRLFYGLIIFALGCGLFVGGILP